MSYFLSWPFFKVAGLSVIIFIFLDLLWLAVIARKRYFDQLSYLAAVEDGRIIRC